MIETSPPQQGLRCLECGNPIERACLTYYGSNGVTIHLHTWCALGMGGKLTRWVKNFYKSLERNSTERY